MDDLPNPSTAERNQDRKLAFVPMWPMLGTVALFVVLFVIFKLT